MLVAVDLHIHSRFSRATSRDLTLPNLAYWARRKGISVVGTGDFTHPKWRQEMQQQLVEDGSGLLRLDPDQQTEPAGQEECQQMGIFASPDSCASDNFIVDEVRFILSAEISTIYSDEVRTRKLHHVFLAPDLATADRISDEMDRRKLNIHSDGRPIIGLTSQELCELVWSINPDCKLIPAHVWTPWFSVFGSKSGYDDIYECYGDYTDRILALETGLSSDPEMNWRWSALDGFTLVSNSDAHSASKLARECNVFEVGACKELTYQNLTEWVKQGDPKRFLYTVEFYPEEGKYHWDGHRVCSVQWPPASTKEHDGICPRCGGQVTVGVLNRVEELADRPEGYIPEGRPGSRHLVPLEEIIASALGVGTKTKKTQAIYEALIQEFGSELAILIDLPIDDISALAGSRIGQAVLNMRDGKVDVDPGYDGEFGKVRVIL